MAEFKATKSQQQAIDARGSAVLVSAGAGSGKTRVLTERLMSRICHPSHPVDVDSFLIITYTRAAAGELRGRIMEELAQRMAAEPENRRLRRQSALCSKAQIGTIHSFCAALLREHSHLIGLTPDFKIMDEERASTMKTAALERVMEARYAKAPDYPGFLELADSVGAGRDDSRLVKLCLSLHGKMQCHARPDLWAGEQVALMRAEHEDLGQTPWGREILDEVAALSDYWSGELDRLMELMQSEERISAAYLPSVYASADQIRELSRCARLGWDRAMACLPVDFPRMLLRNSPDPALSEMVKQRRTACKKAMDSLAKTLCAPSSELLAQIAATAPAMEALLSLTLDFDRAYAADKRRAGLVDYSDLEHLTAQLLTESDGSPTKLARSLSERYSEIMVDEYQDVSRVQDAIFNALSREGKNLFFVGDVKQSIYRFRLADPGIFTEKYLSYADCDQARESEPRRIMLQENFRSRREILDCANTVFSLCMSECLGELDYDEDAALKPGAVYEDAAPVPELMLLELAGEDDDDEGQSPDKTALEAQLVGKKIISLMGEGINIQGRPLDYGDFCILMRSANSVGGIYRRELANMGIPVAAGQSGDFFSSIEISVMMSMLAVIDNPHQDIPLIAVLRSPAFGFDADELSAIRACDRKGDFYAALCAAAENNEKCDDFLKLLKKLRRIAPDMGSAELLWQLINELDMLAICSAMADGAARRENLMELVELSERFEATGYKGLHRFVLWLRKLAEKNQTSGRAGSGSGVQIMTVHKSKGLEFPVVFLCDTARRFNRQDSQESVLVHPVLGLGPKVTDHKKHIEYPSLARNAIRLRKEREMLSEEMRLLYVALTRPRERLYITAAVKKAEELIDKSAAAVTVPLQPQVLSGAGAPVNWLIYAAIADGQQHLKMGIYDSAGNVARAAADEADGEAPAAEAAPLKLRENMSFVYPYEHAEHLPSKLTATELKGRRERDEDAENKAPAIKRHFRKPELSDARRRATATERGIATHLALQYMDFAAVGSLESIQTEITRLREEKYLTEREASLVNADTIHRLFASKLGERMRKAEKVHREFKFSVLVDVGEFYPEAAGERLLLQGVVDCCLEEDGKLVIIDYKTDDLRTQEQIEERSHYYAAQLKVYALALGRIFGMEVSECLLYFLSAGKLLQITEKDLH